ncbi:transport and Golgi organization protein 6 homolog [Dermacentor andersoni]|uniref:transport and Golgi organization protein 6 homolog n=1 Tax=Dermacentor andersoni TaxID=34620 RepID=UPI002155D408|nr:transport and Golgi organization protein 6 homolog isoform X1 [Dermacentor andersoni]
MASGGTEMAERDIKTIISIIDLLISGKHLDINAQVGSFDLLLQRRLHYFSEAVSTDANLSKILSENAPHLLQPCGSENLYWLFLDHCISLLMLLKNLLDTTSMAATPPQPQGPSQHSSAPPAPPSCLGALQQKTVQSLLQFVVALGVNPNLLPGVGLALEQRTLSGVPECSTRLLPWQKHRFLVASVRALLVCIQSPALCSMVLHHHLVDVLAALLQLCHAPIRKIANDENNRPHSSLESHPSTVNELNSSLASCRAGAPADDVSLIQEMLEDRRHLCADLQYLLENTYQPMVVRELLLLLSNASKLKFQNVSGAKNTPRWLTGICGQLLTQSLLRKGGLAQVILGTFDAWCVDGTGGVVSEEDWKKCETFARIVARIPSTKEITVESYYEGIAAQVVELFFWPQSSSMDKIVFRVACAIVGAMLEEQPQKTSCFVLSKIFRPLFTCTCQQGAALTLNDIVASEEDLGKCIELIHKIVSCLDPGHPILEAIVPVFPVIFEIAICTENTVSYLRKPCEEVLCAVYHSLPSTTAVELLHWCLFKATNHLPLATLRNDIVFVLGSSGGVEAINRFLPLSDEEWLKRSDQAFLAAVSVFQHGGLKESCVIFFMSLLKKLTGAVGDLLSGETNDIVLPPTSQCELNSQDVKDNLLLLHLIENFADLISETLIQNKPSLLEFVVETLNRVTQLSKSAEISSLALQSTVFCLTLMSLLISTEDMAAAKNKELWQQCNQCLASLSGSHSSPEIRNLAHQLQVSVASQGVAAAPQKPSATSNSGFSAPPVADDKHAKAARQKKLAAIAAGFNILSIDDSPSSETVVAEASQQQLGEETARVAPESSGVPPATEGTEFGKLWCELHDGMAPIRGHAFIQLRRMLVEGSAEVWQRRDELLEACHSGIQDEDSYVYLSAIQALSVLVERDLDHLLPWLAEQLSLEQLSVEARLNLGEVLLRVTKNFGDMAPKYRNLLVNSFLCAAKHSNPVIRCSAVSNLGELCGKLGYSFVPITQEILNCLRGLIRDPDALVCHAAVLALGCIIQGMGQSIFQVMPREVKDIYRDLKHLYATTPDNVTKIQAQLAIENLNSATQEFLRSQPRMEKRIQILDLCNPSGS